MTAARRRTPAQLRGEVIAHLEDCVITAATSKDLRRAQKARSAIEHEYVAIRAGRVHEAVELVVAAARAFIGPYAAWIEPYLGVAPQPSPHKKAGRYSGLIGTRIIMLRGPIMNGIGRGAATVTYLYLRSSRSRSSGSGISALAT